MVVWHHSNNNICFHLRKPKMKTNHWSSEEEKSSYISFLESPDDEEVDRNDEKNDYRISQPKYSQLLKELDFSQTRMVKRNFIFFLFTTPSCFI
jgi:hypothetical protein